jgi:hypothetical protein
MVEPCHQMHQARYGPTFWVHLQRRGTSPLHQAAKLQFAMRVHALKMLVAGQRPTCKPERPLVGGF